MQRSSLLFLFFAFLIISCDQGASSNDDDALFISNAPVAFADITVPEGTAAIATEGIPYTFTLTISGVNGLGEFDGAFSNPTGTVNVTSLSLNFTGLTQTATPLTFESTGTISGAFTGNGTIEILLNYTETGIIIENNMRSFLVSVISVAPATTSSSAILSSSSVVKTNADSGPGSLREVLADSSPGSSITFDPALFGSTITLTSEELFIYQDQVIIGPGKELLTIDGNATSCIFNILGNAKVDISDLSFTIKNNSKTGGVFKTEPKVSLIVTDCAIYNK